MNAPPSINSAMSTAMILTRDDVERLLKDELVDSRGAVLDKVAQQYNQQQFKGREQEIAEQIFRVMMRDMSSRIRESLAEHVRHSDQVPRDIILHLANDREAVALPVLQSSPVLSDADLITIVENSGGSDVGKLLAISKREHVSARVSGALVDTSYSQVVTSLLGNTTAQIEESTLGKIADHFARDPEVMDALAGHPRLPMVVVERIIHRTSDKIAQQLREKYQINENEIARNVSHVREDFLLQLVDDGLADKELVELVQQMADEGRLTPSIVMTALCRGQHEFFTAAMAQLAGISLDNANKLLSDRGVLGFHGIYEKSGLPPSMEDAVRTVLHAAQSLKDQGIHAGAPSFPGRLVSQLLESAGDQNIEYLPYFIALIRQHH